MHLTVLEEKLHIQKAQSGDFPLLLTHLTRAALT